MKKRNKRGSLLMDHMGEIIMWAVAIAIGIYFIWAYVLHGGGDSLNKLQTCGALTGNKGECKESCDSVLEAEFTDVGCTGLTNKCCVSRSEDQSDTILPSQYGGNNDYGFEVVSIQADQPTSCQRDTSDANTFICNPNDEVTMNVKIKVRNIRNKALDVFADPIAIINDNGDSIRGPGRYTGTASKRLAETGSTPREEDVETTLKFSSSDAKDGFVIKVYPYAVCKTKECKTADARGRGILKRNVDEFITLRFIGN